METEEKLIAQRGYLRVPQLVEFRDVRGSAVAKLLQVETCRWIRWMAPGFRVKVWSHPVAPIDLGLSENGIHTLHNSHFNGTLMINQWISEYHIFGQTHAQMTNQFRPGASRRRLQGSCSEFSLVAIDLGSSFHMFPQETPPNLVI